MMTPSNISETRNRISVFLVDDHPVVRGGYRRLLENFSDIEVVGEAQSGEEVLQLYGKIRPDVVVMDLNMQGMGGLEATTRLCAKYPEAHILVFSIHDSPMMIRRALDAGASGYLTKASVATQMIEAVRAVATGELFLNREIMPAIVTKLKQQYVDPLENLTRREFEIFWRLASGHSVGLIAEELSISPKTVGVHQTNIMKKLRVHKATELTLLAIRQGVIEA